MSKKEKSFTKKVRGEGAVVGQGRIWPWEWVARVEGRVEI